MFVIIRSWWNKNFIDNGTEQNYSCGDKEKAESTSGSGSILHQGGKSQVQVHPSDKDGNSFVKTFEEKVLQEWKKDTVQLKWNFPWKYTVLMITIS